MGRDAAGSRDCDLQAQTRELQTDWRAQPLNAQSIMLHCRAKLFVTSKKGAEKAENRRQQTGKSRTEGSSPTCTPQFSLAKPPPAPYLPGVRNIVVVVVDDGCPLLIKLDAALAAQLPQWVAWKDKADSP